jgi:ankyrin repeat protein
MDRAAVAGDVLSLRQEQLIPLHYAAFYGQKDVVRLMVEMKSNVDARDKV